MQRNDDKARRTRRVFHWMVAAVFLILVLSGLVLYTPLLSTLAADSWTRIAHRAGAVSLAVAIAAYSAVDSRGMREWVGELAWWRTGARANPDVWKRRHKMVVTLGVAVFAVTGFVQWFLKDSVPRDVFISSVMVHDILFFSAVVVFLLHTYHEFDWWLWRRRRCSSCSAPVCARVCPSDSISMQEDGSVVRDGACNNCRLCMNTCRRKRYYLKVPSQAGGWEDA
ncbi:MAG: hypothetical protein QUS33_11120 [Dehalococcoidia bacterium]|nr:hypothetical protein [Dehalococcoidia bacterium]